MASQKKQQQVQQLTREIQQAPIVGLLNLQNLPAAQLQRMRQTLAQKNVKIFMARKRLLHRALTAANKQNIQPLIEKLKGMPALLFTKENPFALYSLLQKNKSSAAAKPGQIAPHDLTVKAGPTSFAPGPIISELAAVGIKTKVEGGKLAIISDTVIIKEGQPISQKVSDTLKRLDIKPMEIGLDLVSVWEGGLVFDARQLHIDEAEYSNNFTQAEQWAFNLAVDIAHPATAVMETLLQKAFREAKALALEQEILTDATRDEILATAEAQALSVKVAGKIEAQIEPKPKATHPNFGSVTQNQAQELLEKLKKEGTLRQ